MPEATNQWYVANSSSRYFTVSFFDKVPLDSWAVVREYDRQKPII